MKGRNPCRSKEDMMEHYSIKHSHNGIILAFIICVIGVVVVIADLCRVMDDIHTLSKNLVQTQEDSEEVDSTLNKSIECLWNLYDANKTRIDYILTNGVSVRSHQEVMARVNFLLIKEKEREEKRGWFGRKGK